MVEKAIATVAQLKAAIDAGKTRGKAPVFDPGAAPLGTDEEAAGTATPAQAIAEELEILRQTGQARRAQARIEAARQRRFVAAAALVIVVLAAACGLR